MLAVVFTPLGHAGDDGLGGASGPLATDASSDLPFDIQFNFGPEIRQNPAAMRTMELAAQVWESYLADPVTVFIDVDFDGGLGGALGAATSSTGLLDYATLRELLVNDARNEFVVNAAGVASLPDRAASDGIIENLDDFIVQHLPQIDQLKFNLAPGVSFVTQDTVVVPSGNFNVPIGGSTAAGGLLSVNRATLKALGSLTPQNPSYLEPDARIVLSNDTVAIPTGETVFVIDFNPDDGPGIGQFDGLSIAVHEIAHALGFGSSVDGGGTELSPTPLDLFRFSDSVDFYNPGIHPDPTAANRYEQFENFTRELRPNVSMMTDFGASYWTDGADFFAVEVEMADVFGGQQTSHWQGTTSATPVGVMEAALAPGVRSNVTAIDLRALDLIGWDIVSPNLTNVDVSTLYLGPIEGGSIDPRANPFDVDGSGFVSAVDALMVINELNRQSASGEPNDLKGVSKLTDVNGDGHVSAVDALAIINYLNGREGEVMLAHDAAFADEDESFLTDDLQVQWPYVRLSSLT